jgi:hypothetical protein
MSGPEIAERPQHSVFHKAGPLADSSGVLGVLVFLNRYPERKARIEMTGPKSSG